MIDPHVHCRDGKEAHKGTIRRVFEIAEAQGVKVIFDMPNTNPPILNAKDVRLRLKLVPKERRKHYFLYMGATADENQLKESVRAHEIIPEVIGFKLYAGTSTGNLAVIESRQQERVYRTLAKLNYRGVLAVHCEKEHYFKNHLFDPRRPKTHALARPPRAEIESVKDQIRFASQAKFRGVLHIAHISCPESVALVHKARKKMRITCGITPHHLLFDSEALGRPDGLFYKCNPPLRDKKRVVALREMAKRGRIDWIETDHAPHALSEKFLPPYASGYPALYLYRHLREEFLPRIGMDSKQIKQITFENIYKTFYGKLNALHLR